MKKPINYANLFKILPKSKEKIASEMGISPRTIRSLKAGEFEPSKIVRHKIDKYLRTLILKLSEFLTDEKPE